VFLNGQPHVIAVGEDAPPSQLAMRMPAICDKGESVSVPDEVVFKLALCRTNFYGADVKSERRYGR
jgi:hypothetical protein